MYPQSNLSEAAKPPKEVPHFIHTAEKMLSEFEQFNHQEQVEAFNYLRSRLVETRASFNANLRTESENLCTLIDAHNEGTKVIASGI